MATKNELIDNPVRQEVNITRIFDAPRELVFKMWTDPELLKTWWGPKGFTNPVCNFDVRAGGNIHVVMQGPDGTRYPMGGYYHEIIEPERIVFTSLKEDDEGNAEIEVHNTVTFSDENGKTRMTLHAVVMKSTPEAVAAIQGMNTGWNQSIDRFADLLASINK